MDETTKALIIIDLGSAKGFLVQALDRLGHDLTKVLAREIDDAWEAINNIEDNLKEGLYS